MSGRQSPPAELRTPSPPWLRSFAYAAAGLRRSWSSERNFRVQCAAGWAVLGLAALARMSALRGALLCAVVAAVLGMETMNSAVEVLVDLASPQPHPLAKTAKDLAAGAVLAVSLGALAAGLLAFWPLRALAGPLRARPAEAGVYLLGLAVLIGLACARLPGRRSR